MEVYKFKNLENGDILLEKVLLDNTNYTMALALLVNCTFYN